MPAPAVSVVVPTHDRPDQLARLLQAIRSQRLEQPFELIVVDDGSAPDTAAVLQQELERGELDLRVRRNPVALGAAQARNIGWLQARASLVAFTDDDCRPSETWLRAALRRHLESPGAIIQGRTEPDPSDGNWRSLTAHTVRRSSLGPSYETCNIFYPRPLLETLGGFDGAFARQLWPSGEDTDLAWRALEAGHETKFEPEALVFHAVRHDTVPATLRGALRWTPSVRVLAEHPGARAMLYRGIFWNVWHFLLVRSTLALLGPRWLRRVVLGRHLRALRARAADAGAGGWGIAFLLLYDAIETAAILRGAIRYRTPVL